jgi:hypothetical protein
VRFPDRFFLAVLLFAGGLTSSPALELPCSSAEEFTCECNLKAGKYFKINHFQTELLFFFFHDTISLMLL